jgi:uncharacterized protein DUF6476
VAGLKALVIIMGIMLVVGTAALIVAIAGRVSPKAASIAAAPPFATTPIEIPPGSRIEAMSTGPDRLVLQVVLVDGTRELFVIDLATGRRLGTIPVRVAP